jgi:hypothetical protein
VGDLVLAGLGRGPDVHVRGRWNGAIVTVGGLLALEVVGVEVVDAVVAYRARIAVGRGGLRGEGLYFICTADAFRLVGEEEEGLGEECTDCGDDGVTIWQWVVAVYHTFDTKCVFLHSQEVQRAAENGGTGGTGDEDRHHPD